MDNNKLDTITNLFEGKEIRSIWNSEKEEYFFSVVDVISALTDSNIPRNYWSDLKRKLKNEGSQLHENIVQLKMKSQKDGNPQNFEENISKWMEINDLLKEEKILSNIIILDRFFIKGLIDDNYNFNMHIAVDEQENILNINYNIKK